MDDKRKYLKCFQSFFSLCGELQHGFTSVLFASLQFRPEKEKKQKEPQKVKQKAFIQLPQTSTSRREISSPSPSLLPSSSSSPNSNPGGAPVAAPVDQKKVVDAALRMIAEDMLPLRWLIVLVLLQCSRWASDRKINKLGHYNNWQVSGCFSWLCCLWNMSYNHPTSNH